MAFSFGNAGGPTAGSGGVSQGPDLDLIQTEALGFLSLAGDARLRLTSQWSQFPQEHASLISIASRRGLVAAAGPDAVVIASTEAIRKAFDGPKDGDSEIRSFEPQMKLPLPPTIRICQLAFTADEAYLVLSAEQGGGLAVYEVQALEQGSTKPAFEMSTNGEALRALVPNPRSERGELCAVVTVNGKLLMANMKDHSFVSGPNGQILKDRVTCVAWSTKGKQLVAGLEDGTIHQMTPEGNTKAEIPRPPDLDTNYFVSSLTWLENDVFLSFHVSIADQAPQTRCHLITRQGQNFQFQKLSNPVDPFGELKVPHHTVVRLKDFLPNLQDLLICSSTATIDIGLLARSKTPLAPGAPSNVFTTAELADDSKRAILPMGTDSMVNPVVVGAALDLSSRESVYKPIPTDELDQSPGPLPGYWVLNSDGVLSAWWVVYTESIRTGTTYSGLVVIEDNAASSVDTTTPKPAPVQSNPFATTTASSPFGAPSAAAGAAFGSPSVLGSKTSPWAAQSSSIGASAPTFGSSSFGSGAASSAPKFGTTSGFGTAAAPAFGQSTGLGNPNNTDRSQGPFGGANPTPASSSGGFATFASKGGFSSLGSNTAGSAANIFSSTKSESPEVSMDTDTSSSIFRSTNAKSNAGTGGIFGSQPFKLTSSFQPPSTEKSMFGGGFSASIDEATKPAAPNPLGSSTSIESTTPTSTPAPNRFLSPAPSTSQGKGFLSNVFGSSSASQTPTATSQIKSESETPRPLRDIPDVPLPPESTSKATYPLGDSSSSSAATADTSDAKGAEDAPLPPDDDFPDSTPTKPSHEISPVPADDAPLPPDPITNKKAYASPLPPLPGISAGAKPKPVDDSPLPPDPITQPKAYEGKLPALPIAKLSSGAAGPGFKFPTNPPPMPSDSDDDDLSEEEEGTEAVSEGSGVDVAKDLSPSSSSHNKTPGFTPQSSFGGLAGSFSTISRPDQERRSFFGELGRDVPVLPQPNPLSPRSPSPVRGTVPSRILGKDQSRSFSAPGMASHILGASRRQTQSRLGASITAKDSYVEDALIEQQRKAKARKEAEETQLLLDEEDDAVQSLLRTEVKPTLELDEFIAHSGVAPPAGDSVPAQVEAVYRDINSMIDTLGLNARSLAGFIKGQKELINKEYTRQDLGSPEDWTLIGLESLARIIDEDLSNALDEARVTDISGKIEECEDIQRELARDRNKQADLKKVITSRLDPEQTITNRALPLSAEQAAQQSDLRREYAKFTKLLAEAEENLTLLKAKIVSANSASGKGGPTPTIEAVVRTITKLTSMVEKRSGDIDVLENQMRKLRLGSHGPGSREGSPFTTPNAKRLNASVFSPDRSARENTPQRGSVLRHSVSGSIGGSVFQTPPRKKLSGFGDTEKKAVKEKRDRRAAVLSKLKSSLQRKEASVWAVDDIE
ncbi:hypothetical protein F5Y04DRAFT_267494 [Hypomontagnella monticulosa]|nr:hypothetical protein F5Y04DRAFT_267494 [Hypomontagnella monticulosa]